MPYYNSLHPRTLEEVFSSPSCSLAVVMNRYGEAHTRAFMVNMLNDLIDFFNVGKSMGALQVAQTADLVIEEYYYLKPDDFKLCFNRAKKGYYGKLYDRIDGQVILGWLASYDTERGQAAEELSIGSSRSWDREDTGRTSERQTEAYHAFRKYDFERKFNAKN